MSTAAGAAAAEQKPPLLGVNTKLLKADEELRRIFGSAVIAEEAREARQGELLEIIRCRISYGGCRCTASPG